MGSIQQGKQQSAMLNYESEQASADAKAEQGAAQVQAEKIRKAGRLQASQANTELAASGVDTSYGTSDIINQSIMKNTETDALTAILNGTNRANKMNSQAQADSIGADNAESAGYINAASSALGGAAKAYGAYDNWKKAAKFNGGATSSGATGGGSF